MSTHLSNRLCKLKSEFADLADKVHHLTLLKEKTRKEADRRMDNLDEVIYLNDLLRHLRDVNEGLRYEAFYVKEKNERRKSYSPE